MEDFMAGTRQTFYHHTLKKKKKRVRKDNEQGMEYREAMRKRVNRLEKDKQD